MLVAAAEITQQRGGAGSLHDALLLRLPHEQHDDTGGEGHVADSSQPQGDSVRGVGRHQVSVVVVVNW